MQKLKIVFVLAAAGTAPTGGFRIIAGYADRLRARGHDVTLLLPAGAPVKPTRLRDRIRSWFRGLPQPPAPGEVPFITSKEIQVIRIAGKNTLEPGDFPPADIYIATWWETVEWLKGAPADAAKLHLVQGYEVFPYLPVERVHAAYKESIEKVVVSKWLQDKLLQHYSAPSILVENAVDSASLKQPNRKKSAPQTVGFLFSVAITKNSAMAIAACRILRQRFPDLRVFSFGSHAPRPTEHFPNWIDFQLTPSNEEIARIYGSCDVWLFSSDEEGFGLPILEAMAAGTPVVATPAGAAPQIIDSNNGALVSHDADDMAAAAARILLMQPDVWKKMSLAAEKTAQRRNWDAAADEFESAICAVVNRARS